MVTALSAPGKFDLVAVDLKNGTTLHRHHIPVPKNKRNTRHINHKTQYAKRKTQTHSQLAGPCTNAKRNTQMHPQLLGPKHNSVPPNTIFHAPCLQDGSALGARTAKSRQCSPPLPALAGGACAAAAGVRAGCALLSPLPRTTGSFT